MSRSLPLIAVAVAGVIGSVAMVLTGLPEATPAQSVLLELSSLPLSISVAAGLWLLARRAERPPRRRGRLVLLTAATLAAIGLVLIGWAYLWGPRQVVHTGQALVWMSLFGALIVVVRLQPRRRWARFEAAEKAVAADGAEPDDE